MPNDLEDSSIKFIPDIDHDLLAGLLRGEVVIFVGNGVSRLGGVPSWDDLATSFWKDCFDQGFVNFATYNRLKNELKDPLELLSICSEKLGSAYLATELKNKLYIPDEKRKKLNKIYGYIRDFQAGYVTTNYDSGLEDAQLTQEDISQDEETLRDKLKEIPKRLTRVELNNSFKDHKNKIAYLHGSASLPTEHGIENKIILTLPDYIRHYREKQPGNGKCFLENLFKKTCLFIGYGLKEQEILQHLVTPGEPVTHYLLQGLFSDEQCILKEYERFYQSIHVKLIPYNLSERGYAQLEEVLQSWSRTFRQAKIDYYKKRIQRDEDAKNLCLIQEQNNEAFK